MALQEQEKPLPQQKFVFQSGLKFDEERFEKMTPEEQAAMLERRKRHARRAQDEIMTSYKIAKREEEKEKKQTEEIQLKNDTFHCNLQRSRLPTNGIDHHSIGPSFLHHYWDPMPNLPLKPKHIYSIEGQAFAKRAKKEACSFE